MSDPWEDAIRRYMRQGMSRDDAARRVNADVFGDEVADDMATQREQMEAQVEAAEHHPHCAELAPGEWECSPECPVYSRRVKDEAQARRWRWGSVE